MKIYIDVNGTFIYRTIERGAIRIKPAKYLKEFLTNALAKHDVYWLSTVCRGNSEEVLAYLQPHLPKNILKLAARIKPTLWKNYKIEAIDLKEDFLWFDDVLLLKEEEILLTAGKLDKYVRVNHYKNRDFFKDWLSI